MDFEVKNTDNYGMGLYAKYSYVPGEVILKFNGAVLKKEDIKDFSGADAANYLQIGKDVYLDMQKKNEFFINHSCVPNAGIKISLGQAFLVAIYSINVGDQLFFDYSTTSTEDASTWHMKCKCGNFSCRKIITGFQSLPDARKKFYLDKGIVPSYLP